MNTLSTPEEIQQTVRDYEHVYDRQGLPVRFPSGRSVYITADEDNLASRSKRWLSQYIVTTNERSITLLKREFSFESKINRDTITAEIASHTRHIEHQARQRALKTSQLDALDNSHVKGIGLDALQNLGWPELTSVEMSEGGNWGIVASFLPVLFMLPSGEIRGISSSLRINIDRSGNWHLGREGRTYIHPHVNEDSRVICQGNIQGLCATTVDNNQVRALLDLIRRWRLGYGAQDVYNSYWQVSAWKWLHCIRNGSIGLDEWDGKTVQKSTGEIVLLEEALDGKVDQRIHRGIYEHRGISGVEMAETCTAGCGVDTLVCPCHTYKTCVGCQQEETRCICEGSQYMVRRRVGAPWLRVDPDWQTRSASRLCGACVGRSGGIVVDEQPIWPVYRPNDPIVWCLICSGVEEQVKELYRKLGREEPVVEEARAQLGGMAQPQARVFSDRSFFSSTTISGGTN